MFSVNSFLRKPHSRRLFTVEQLESLQPFMWRRNFVIAIAIATIPGPKMAEETVVDQRQRQGDVTCTLAQVNSLINGRRFL